MEFNDIYDKERHLTGRTHLRGTRWKKGEYGLVVCVWVYDGAGNVLLTRRAPEKSGAGSWENSGGSVLAGENSLQGIVRELREETGIQAQPEEFELLDSILDGRTHFDHYCLHKAIPIERIVLQPGETDAVMWATFDKVHEMIASKKIHPVIARQFRKYENALRLRQNRQNGN